MPAAAWPATKSKWGVSPLITHPTQTIACDSARVRARQAAAWGSSKEPGTQCTSTASSGSPAEDSARQGAGQQALADALVEARRHDGEAGIGTPGLEPITPEGTRGATGHDQSGSEVSK